MNFSAMPCARRGGSISKNMRGEHHRAVERDAARVVADEHRAPARRHVLDAVRLDREVVLEEELQRRERRAEVLLRDAVGIDAVRVERDLEAVETFADLGIDGKRQSHRLRRLAPEPTVDVGAGLARKPRRDENDCPPSVLASAARSALLRPRMRSVSQRPAARRSPIRRLTPAPGRVDDAAAGDAQRRTRPRA